MSMQFGVAPLNVAAGYFPDQQLGSAEPRPRAEPAGSFAARWQLINDLDLTVIDPAGRCVGPGLLCLPCLRQLANEPVAISPPPSPPGSAIGPGTNELHARGSFHCPLDFWVVQGKRWQGFVLVASGDFLQLSQLGVNWFAQGLVCTSAPPCCFFLTSQKSSTNRQTPFPSHW